MNTTHDERHEALLQAVLTRDRTRADPEIARLLAACARCREQLEGLEQVLAGLDELDHERRTVMATPRSDAQAAIEARIRPTLERLRDEDRLKQGGTSAPASRRWPWLVLAAATVLAGFFIARSLRPRARPDDQTLGGKIELVSPGETLGPADVFECRFEAPRGTRFKFHVGDASGGILAVEKGEPRWKPTTEERAQFPQHFRWWVTTIDVTNPDLSVESEKRWSSLSP
jgi:hypothetical protein